MLGKFGITSSLQSKAAEGWKADPTAHAMGLGHKQHALVKEACAVRLRAVSVKSTGSADENRWM